MISPSPLEAHLDIVRALGSRTRPLDRAARRGALRRRRAAATNELTAPITIRPAARCDADAIARLAQLDGHGLPKGRRLVAESAGRILAAADIGSGRTVADPFEPTAAVAQLVALRAQQLRNGDLLPAA
jgi:hypothetical protein